MGEVSRFRLDGGGVVNVEVDDDVLIGRSFRDHRGVYEATTTLGDASRTIGSAVADVVRGVLDVPGGPRPDEVDIEFSVRMNPDAGVVITDGAGSGHFRIRATWRRESHGARPSSYEGHPLPYEGPRPSHG
ncbi:CU044_2847 family protein [Streptomyces sp. NPDC055078]